MVVCKVLFSREKMTSTLAKGNKPSLDDTWTISDISSNGAGSLRNSVDFKTKLRDRNFSPISSFDSHSDPDDQQVIVKPFLKRTTGGYQAATEVQSPMISTPQPETQPSEIQSGGMEQKPEEKQKNVTFENLDAGVIKKNIKNSIVTYNADSEMVSATPNAPVNGSPVELFTIQKVGYQALSSANNLRGYEIAPPKVTTHMDFLEYKKLQHKKRNLEMVRVNNDKKEEEDKPEMKIPETLYTYIGTNSPSVKKEERKEKDKQVKKLEKIEPKPTPEVVPKEKKGTPETKRKIVGRKIGDEMPVLNKKDSVIGGSTNIQNEIESSPRVERSPNPSRSNVQRTVEKVTNNASNMAVANTEALKHMENAVRESENKLAVFQKMLDRLLEQKEREYGNILSKTTNQVSSTITNSMSKMGIDIKSFYKQFEKLQKVTSDVTSKFGKQLSEDQKKAQNLLNKQMKQIEEIGSKIKQIEKKSGQIKDQKDRKSPLTTSRAIRKTGPTFVPQKELSLAEIHEEVLKKHPSLFKLPSVSILLYCQLMQLVGRIFSATKSRVLSNRTKVFDRRTHRIDF